MEVQPQASVLDPDFNCPKVSKIGIQAFVRAHKSPVKVKHGVCSTFLTALICCSAETADMRTSTPCPGQPGWAPWGGVSSPWKRWKEGLSQGAG